MKKDLIKDTAVYGLSDFIFKFIAFAIFPFIAAKLTVAQFGVMELVLVTVALLAIVANLGIGQGVMRHYYEDEKKDSLVSTSIFMLALAIVFITIIALGILYFFSARIEEELKISYLVVAIALLASIASTLLQFIHNIIRLQFAAWKYMYMNIIRYSLSIGLILLLVVFYEKGIGGYFFGSLVAGWVVLPFGLWLIKKELRFKFDINRAKQVLKFGYPFVFSGLAYWLFGSMDRWMLIEMTDDLTEVGLYSVAFKFATIILFVYQAFGNAWSPHAYRLYKEDPDYKKIFVSVLDQWFYLLIIVGSVLSLFSIDILRLLTPEPYWGAADVLGIVVMGIVIYGTTQITMLGISLEKKTKLIARGAWMVAGLNVLLNLVLIPRFGAVGAGVATLISYTFMTLYYLYWTQKLHKLPINTLKFASGFITLLLVLVVSAYFNQHDSNLINISMKAIAVMVVISIPVLLGIFHVSDIKKVLALASDLLLKPKS